MQSPQELSGQLDDLLDGVESIEQSAVDTERMLERAGDHGVSDARILPAVGRRSAPPLPARRVVACSCCTATSTTRSSIEQRCSRSTEFLSDVLLKDNKDDDRRLQRRRPACASPRWRRRRRAAPRTLLLARPRSACSPRSSGCSSGATGRPSSSSTPTRSRRRAIPRSRPTAIAPRSSRCTAGRSCPRSSRATTSSSSIAENLTELAPKLVVEPQGRGRRSARCPIARRGARQRRLADPRLTRRGRRTRYAELTAGLKAIQIAAILAPPPAGRRGRARAETFIAGLLGGTRRRGRRAPTSSPRSRRAWAATSC